jgi:signal transduction histidine kinase
VVIRRYKTETDREYVEFEIEDSGIGIPEDQKDNIFKVFVQADGSMTRKFGGTGLGLPLSKSLANLLGGDLSLKKTEVGKGSTFVVRIESKPQSWLFSGDISAQADEQMML